MKLSDQIRELVGPEATELLTERYGGGRVVVPQSYRDDHPLVKLLGPESAAKLIRRFGGTKIHIAQGRQEIRRERNDMIRRDWEAGKTVTQLAREYLLSERQIWRICWERLSRA